MANEAQLTMLRYQLNPHFLFRWAHPPLAIPRSVVTATEEKGLLRRFIRLGTKADGKISFHLHPRQFGWPEDLVGPDI